MSAWIGIGIGGVLGGVVAALATKKFLHRVDVGIVGAAVGAGALIGGAIVGPSTASAAEQPTTYTLPVSNNASALVHVGDTVTLVAPNDHVTITSITNNGSDAVSSSQCAGCSTYTAQKLGGAVFEVTLSDGSVNRVKIEVVAG